MVKNILFIFEGEMDEFKGGVQRITKTLSEQFEKYNINTYFLATQFPKEHLNLKNQFYLPNLTETLNPKNIIYLKKLLEELNINSVINQLAVNTDILRLIKKSKSTEVKVISVHHNTIKGLFENYVESQLRSLDKFFPLRYLNKTLKTNLLYRYHVVKNHLKFKYILNNSDYLVLYFEVLKDELNTRYNIKINNKVKAITNPLPFENVETNLNKRNSILYVGRLEYIQKRVDILIDIWEKIYRDYPEWQLDIVGDGPEKDELKILVENHKIKNVIFHGFQDPYSFYSESKILCMTSAFEGFGMVLIEAQAHGTVPISFKCFNSIDEVIISGETGIITPQYDNITFEIELRKLIEDKEKLDKMAINARNHIENFKVEKIAKLWLDLLN